MLTSLLVSLLAAAPAPAEAEKLLTADALRAHVRFLASDELEGRLPSSRGDQLAERYIASQFELLGLKPGAADGSWYQKFELVGVIGAPPTLTFSVPKTAKSLTFQNVEDYVAVAATQTPVTKLENAELVFVGYGIVAPEYGWNDFKDVDVRGKVVVVMNNDPANDPKLFEGTTRLYYGRWDYKFEQADRMGAVGCIIIHTTPSAGYPWQVVQTSWTGELFDANAKGALLLKSWLTEDAMKKVVAQSGKNLDTLRAQAERRDFRPVPLGVTLSTSFENTVATKHTGNVIGVWPGSDPVLKNEYVVFTAHHDHLGRKPNIRTGEDDIYNGAIDNASGVAALLTVARALSSMPVAPKRSIVFAAVAAEEQGLLGSQYFVEHPPVPIRQIAANLNVDGLNVLGRTRDVSVIGLGKSTIDPLIVELAKGQGRIVTADAMPDRGSFYRSDQFNFAKVGVPAAYFSSGQDFIGRPPGWGKKMEEAWENKRYHQPSDELTPDWDLSGALEDVQLYFRLTLALGNADAMPQWKKGDEFEAARLKSLQN